MGIAEEPGVRLSRKSEGGLSLGRRPLALGWLVLMALALAVFPSARGQSENTDPINTAHEIVLHQRKGVKLVSSESFPGAVPRGRVDRGPLRVPKLSKLAQQAISTSAPRQRDRFVVHFLDDVQIPRFPQPAGGPRDSEANRNALRRADELVAQIKAQRAPAYQTITGWLRDQYDARVLATFWLINGVVVDMPIARVQALSQRPDVVFVETKKAELRTANANPDDDVEDGRALIRSDPYLGWGYGGISWIGGIGVIDSGMRFSHKQLALMSPVMGDCINGGPTCLSGNLMPEDQCDHGTGVAAIIAGNTFVGNQYHGITADPNNGAHIDSWKIWSPLGDGTCGGDPQFSVQAIENAVDSLDRIINVSGGGSNGPFSSTSWAANNAFDAGVVFIAANGNEGPGPFTVRDPAAARKVIGVGAFAVDTGAQYAGQSEGPVDTIDDRIKPDIQAPNLSETAGDASDTALSTLGGTSGAAPYATGAAYLLRRLLGGFNADDPGHVYSMLILSGDNPYPFDNTKGAGRIRLPVHGVLKVAKVAVVDGGTVDIPLDIGKYKPKHGHVMDAALWWPEENTQQFHSEIHLEILNNKGAVVAKSVDADSIFQRAQATLPGKAGGVWKARVRGAKVNLNSLKDPQIVYVSFLLNKKP